jgi:hypothetical protein
MANFNPHDWARQQNQDPTLFMKNDLQVQKQKLILRHASLPTEMRSHVESRGKERDHGELKETDQLVHSDDDEDNGCISSIFD